MSISIGAGYDLPEEKNRHTRANSRGAAHDPERMAVVDDLNLKLQARYPIFCFLSCVHSIYRSQ